MSEYAEFLEARMIGEEPKWLQYPAESELPFVQVDPSGRIVFWRRLLDKDEALKMAQWLVRIFEPRRVTREKGEKAT